MSEKPQKNAPLSATERSRRHADKIAAIDAELDEAFANINWERRNAASRSLVDFVLTYCVGLMIDTAPTGMMLDCLREMETALSQSRPYNIELPRGMGKTSFAEMAVLWLLAATGGKRKFAVIVSHDSRAAANILRDIWRPIVERDSFAQDFPEVSMPFILANGSFRRRQAYRGIPTEIEKNAQTIRFARLVRDGVELPTSQSVITVRGITSGIRGCKSGKLRPDVVLLDDIQSAESAASPEQVQKLMDIIRKDVFNLAGRGKLSVLMTSTPIAPDDLCAKIEANPNWKTTKHPAIIKWPQDLIDKEHDGKWAEYFRMYDAENAADEPHQKSLDFYRQNQTQMDAGAVLFAPDRYRPEDGHISGLQALLEKRHLIGGAAFCAEYQMRPKRETFSIDITPNKVIAKADAAIKKLEVPDGYTFVCGAIDLNVSYAITLTLLACKPDTTAAVIYHKLFRCQIDGKLPDAEYNQRVIEQLHKTLTFIKCLNVKIDALAIDAGGRNYDAVCGFAKICARQYGISACSFLGRSANVYNPFVRSRLRDAINHSVLAGNPAEHVKSGAGFRYVFFDADYYKSRVQNSLLAPFGTAGGLSLYAGDGDEHGDFAIQVCNEKLRSLTQKNGKEIYSWVTREPHDYLDCLAMCYAVCGQSGISGASVTAQPNSGLHNIRRPLRPIKPRIKIV